MVPLTDETLTIDVLTGWKLPVIVVARTALGTINHSLLTLEALRRRDIRSTIRSLAAEVEAVVPAL